MAATVVVAAVLLLAGIALAAPDLLRTRDAPASAQTPSPEAPMLPSPGEAAPTVESLRAETASGDPVQALPALAELRSRAFTTADPTLLYYVNVPGSEAQQADQEQVNRLAAEGHALSGLAVEVSVVDGGGTASTEEATATAELRVRMHVSDYAQVDSAGAVLRYGQAQQQEVLVVLVRSEGIWRISRILPP